MRIPKGWIGFLNLEFRIQQVPSMSTAIRRWNRLPHSILDWGDAGRKQDQKEQTCAPPMTGANLASGMEIVVVVQRGQGLEVRFAWFVSQARATIRIRHHYVR